MKNKTNMSVLLLFSLVCFLASSIIGCAQTPKPVQAPTTAPSDIPTMSKDEASAYVWSQLPVKLPSEYNVAQFSKESRVATYEGDAKWTFSVSGSVSDTQKLPSELVEKLEDYWVERCTHKVTTCDLILHAVFYEKTKLIEIVEIWHENVKTRIETDETPIKKEFQIEWMNVEDHGSHYMFNGVIKNIGKVPLKNLGVKFFLYDEEDNIVATEQTHVKPNTVAPGEIGEILSRVTILRIKPEYYNILFLTGAGEAFHQSTSPSIEKACFYHIGEEKITHSALRLEPTKPEDIEKFNTRVEATDELVRNTSLTALKAPSERIEANSEAWKIWKLHNWVASNIEYVSDPKGKEYFAYAHETLEAKAGDCDDIAILLASLYQATGLDAIIACVDTDNVTGYDHAAVLVYWDGDVDTFHAKEREIMLVLGLTKPTREFYTLHFGSGISEFLTEQDVSYQSYEGIWIVADPIFTEVKNMVGHITHRPYTIRSVFNVGD